MRILVLAPELRGHGGIQRYLRGLARAWGEPPLAAQVRVLELPANPTRPQKAAFLLRAAATAAALRPDLVHAGHVGLAPVARLAAALAGSPYWVSAYGIDVWGDIPRAKVAALRAAHRVVAISDYTRRQVTERARLNPLRVVLLPCSLDGRLGSLSPDADGFRRLAGGIGPAVLTVGRLAPAERYKGQDTLIRGWRRVLSRVPGATLLLAGDGDDRSRLEALAKDQGVSDAVRFLGSVSDEVLAAAYQACDLFAMPAATDPEPPSPRGEGFGIVFLEAMDFGKPVLAPDRGAPAEFIRDREDGRLVDPEDADAVADAVAELLLSPERARMGERARERIRRDFSFDVFRSNAQRLLKEVGA